MDKIVHKSLPAARTVKIAVFVVLAFLAGYLLRSFLHPNSATGKHEHPGEQTLAQETAWWTCSMHPQIRQPKPGKCPICFMDLILVAAAQAEVCPREISFSQEAVKLMEVETSPVERKFIAAEIRMVGKVDYDETRVKNIAAWVAGRIDRLYVDFTGITVNRGDHMVELYSPELISGQAELLGALQAAAGIKPEASDLMKSTTSATLEAAREKLRLLGLGKDQVDRIESSGKTLTHITIYSPMGGIVIQKHAIEGVYVNTGTPIYTVADLSRLWVKLDAYESDLVWIRYGQEVEFTTTEAYPGEVFKGWISFIDPVLNEKTRTVKVRINVDNSVASSNRKCWLKRLFGPTSPAPARLWTPKWPANGFVRCIPTLSRTQPAVVTSAAWTWSPLNRSATSRLTPASSRLWLYRLRRR